MQSCNSTGECLKTSHDKIPQRATCSDDDISFDKEQSPNHNSPKHKTSRKFKQQNITL
jgi:hypothetical protein